MGLLNRGFSLSMPNVMWDEICQRENASLWRMPDGVLTERVDPAPVGVLPGSFHPLHEGHKLLRSAAERWLGGAVYYEMTVTNADKPALDIDEIKRRSEQFAEHPLWITNAPTFVKKAEMLPNMVFVVGADTAERIVQARFYEDCEQAMRNALERIRDAGGRFLVAGRFFGGKFLTLADVTIPPGFETMFEPLPETAFRHDVSSTELRGEETARKSGHTQN